MQWINRIFECRLKARNERQHGEQDRDGEGDSDSGHDSRRLANHKVSNVVRKGNSHRCSLQPEYRSESRILVRAALNAGTKELITPISNPMRRHNAATNGVTPSPGSCRPKFTAAFPTATVTTLHNKSPTIPPITEIVAASPT